MKSKEKRKEFYSQKNVDVAKQKYFKGEITSKEYLDIRHFERLQQSRRLRESNKIDKEIIQEYKKLQKVIDKKSKKEKYKEEQKSIMKALEEKTFLSLRVKESWKKHLNNQITFKQYQEIKHSERLKYLRGNIWKDIAKKNAKESKKEYRLRPEIKEYQKEYRLRPEVKLSREKYRQKNKDKLNKESKEYYYKNKLELLKKGVEYRNKNREKINQRARDYNKRPEVKAKRKKDLNYVLKERLRASLKDAFKRYSTTGKIMSSRKYEVDYKEIIEHLKPFPEKRKEYHIDHIIPLSRFNFDDPKQVKKAFAPENHQWLPKEINQWKGDRLIIPMTKEQQDKLLKRLKKEQNYY